MPLKKRRVPKAHKSQTSGKEATSSKSQTLVKGSSSENKCALGDEMSLEEDPTSRKKSSPKPQAARENEPPSEDNAVSEKEDSSKKERSSSFRYPAQSVKLPKGFWKKNKVTEDIEKIVKRLGGRQESEDWKARFRAERKKLHCEQAGDLEWRVMFNFMYDEFKLLPPGRSHSPNSLTPEPEPIEGYADEATVKCDNYSTEKYFSILFTDPMSEEELMEAVGDTLYEEDIEVDGRLMSPYYEEKIPSCDESIKASVGGYLFRCLHNFFGLDGPIAAAQDKMSVKSEMTKGIPAFLQKRGYLKREIKGDFNYDWMYEVNGGADLELQGINVSPYLAIGWRVYLDDEAIGTVAHTIGELELPGFELGKRMTLLLDLLDTEFDDLMKEVGNKLRNRERELTEKGKEFYKCVDLYVAVTKLITSAVNAGIMRLILTDSTDFLFILLDQKVKVEKKGENIEDCPVFLKAKHIMLKRDSEFFRFYFFSFAAASKKFAKAWNEFMGNVAKLLEKYSSR